MTLALSIFVWVASVAYLFIHGIDAIEGRNPYQFFADANTYHDFARRVMSSNASELIGVGRNLIGPLVIVLMSGDNYYVISAVNVAIFYTSVRLISWDAGLDPLLFAVLLLLNPMTISSLMAANKEILSLLFLALLLRAWLRQSGLWLGLAALVAIGVRWQLLAFLLLLLPLALGWRLPRRNRVLILVSLSVGLSIAYALGQPLLSDVNDNFIAATQSYSEGSGLFSKLVLLQMEGLYFLVAPLKAAHLLFGLGLRFDRLLSPVEIYNDVWQLLGSTSLLMAFTTLLAKRLFRLENDLVFISVIYILFFSLSPIYAPRYFYVVYVIWTLVYCLRPQIVQSPRFDGISKLHPLAHHRG